MKKSSLSNVWVHECLGALVYLQLLGGMVIDMPVGPSESLSTNERLLATEHAIPRGLQNFASTRVGRSGSMTTGKCDAIVTNQSHVIRN